MKRDNYMNSPVTYIPSFGLVPEYGFRILWDELEWLNVTDRRREYWTNWWNRDYTYGKGEYARTYKAQKEHWLIGSIADAVQRETGLAYNACFLNGYETGKHALGWHADDDPAIDHKQAIAVVTLYDGEVCPVEFVEARNGSKMLSPTVKGVPGERVLQVMPKEPKTPDNPEVETFSLGNGSLLLMGAGMQQTHLHQVPKATGYATRPRISLTYRRLLFQENMTLLAGLDLIYGV